MDMEKLKQHLYVIADTFDNIPVTGRTARVRLTAGVDSLMNLANGIEIPQKEEKVSDAKKDVVNDEHDCTES